jgi:hypothetical protein
MVIRQAWFTQYNTILSKDIDTNTENDLKESVLPELAVFDQKSNTFLLNDATSLVVPRRRPYNSWRHTAENFNTFRTINLPLNLNQSTFFQLYFKPRGGNLQGIGCGICRVIDFGKK